MKDKIEAIKKQDWRKINEITINHKEALSLSEEIDKTLDINAFIVGKSRIYRIVAIEHVDGSYLEFHSACFRRLSKDWYAVFTEHHGKFVYHKEDIKNIKEWICPKYLYYNKDF